MGLEGSGGENRFFRLRAVTETAAQAQKARLRQTLLSERDAIGETQSASLSNALCEILVKFVLEHRAKQVLCFYPVGSEVKLFSFFEAAEKHGIALFFPCCEGDELRFFRVEPQNLSTLEKGRFGIPEPEKSAPAYLKSANDLCLVPCLAATKSGERIGYGRGYYDRFLAAFPDLKSAAVLFERFLIPGVPQTGHDKRVNYLVTERRTVKAL